MRGGPTASARQACRLLGLSRPVRRSDAKPPDDSVVIEALNKLVDRHPRFGFRKLLVLLRKESRPWNHKHVWRA